MGLFLERLKGDAARRRVIAGRVGGLLWLFAAVATPVLTLLPDVDVAWPGAMAALAVSAVVWGVLATVVLDWRRMPAATIDVATAVGVAYTAVTVLATGGPESPARLHTLLVLVYAAGFLRPRAAIAAFASCAAVYALPAGGVAELAFTAPVFFVVGGVILGGRRLLTDQALTDPLTGLANHRAFQERLHVEVARAQRHGRPLTLALIDLDPCSPSIRAGSSTRG